MASKVIISDDSFERELTSREKDILRSIIHLYILKASPIGSRHLAKYLEKEMKLSPATIRNVMSDLEDMDYISHPHTSAGRIPTDKGYRFYVDSLMNIEKLSGRDILTLKKNLSAGSSDTVLKDASKLLGMISRYLGIVEIPHLTELIVLKIELIALSTNKILVVLALDSNIVRTVTLESELHIELKHLDEITVYINERISGRTLKYIRDNFFEMVSDIGHIDTPLIRLFIGSIDKIFESQSTTERIHIAGTQNLLKNPEFEDLDKVRGVIELVENEEIIVHLLDKYEDTNGIKVLIGNEIHTEPLKDYSMIVTNYKIGSASGAIGLIGPKRMNYSKMISLVKYVSELISLKD
ncbi:MAG: heat-inducible transcription repressor HrcA [Ignavibacteriae bacterium]|nr:heat-inducible transcription repressor HrcA [Ignavibacteriota bacterium]